MLGITPARIISNAIVLLVAVVIHEYAHARVAYAMGDDTAKNAGRMTLDPRANIYPLGFLIGVLIGFAILGSAPISRHRMRNPRWGMFWAVLAGPVSNLLVAIVFALPLRFLLAANAIPDSILGMRDSFMLPAPMTVWGQMIFLNLLLFFFNLLPLSPLDGWTVLFALLPPGPAIWWERNRQNSAYVLIGLVVLAFVSPQFAAAWAPLRYLNLLGVLIGEPTNFMVRLLLGI